MIKVIFSVILSLSLFGCISLKIGNDPSGKSTLIRQDKVIIQYEEKYLAELQRDFPKHKLNHLNLITKKDNVKLQGLFLDNPNSRDVIFYIPGSGMNVSRDAIRVFTELSQLDKDVVFFDRRGTGASAGIATVENMITDSLEQVTLIHNRFNPDKLIVHGFSLGSFIAGQLVKSDSVEVNALVLQGSASNIDAWYEEAIPWYISSFVEIDLNLEEDVSQIDNKIVVSEFYDGPLFVIAGEEDIVVPAILSEQLFNASKSENKKLMLVRNANHRTMLKNIKEINTYKQFLTTL
jgi:hypothetical protein